MAQEFYISVTPVARNDYLVRTEKVAPGVPLAEELVTWSISDWLATAEQLMNDPLESLLQEGTNIHRSRAEKINARNSISLTTLGQTLYSALFQGALRDSLIAAQGIAQNQQQLLRLRLGLKDTTLARLPWEVMYQEQSPIATGPYIAFSRYHSGMNLVSPLPSSIMPSNTEIEDINVLMVIASPNDQVGLDLLKQEASKLKEEFEHQTNRNVETSVYGKIQVTVLEQPGREELTQALEQRNFQVLHYSGHSNLGINGGEIYLVHRNGLTETLSGNDLAGLLANNNIQMAVFNSCLGSYAATRNKDSGESREQNLTETLVKQGVKCVLAMSERIPDEVALTLAQLFYRNLSQGYSVDLCVSRMRQGLISAYGSHQIYWALPTLYLQPEFDGYLCSRVNSPKSEELFSEYKPRLTNEIIYSQEIGTKKLPLDVTELADITLHSLECDCLGEENSGILDLNNNGDYTTITYPEDTVMISDSFNQLYTQKATGDETTILQELRQFPKNINIQREHTSTSLNHVDENNSPQEKKESSWRQVSIQLQGTINGIDTVSHDNLYHTDSIRMDQIHTVPKSYNSSGEKSLGGYVNLKISRKSIISTATTGMITTLLGLSWCGQNQQPRPRDFLPLIPSSAPLITHQFNINLKTSATGIITSYATKEFTQGNLKSGLEAVEELLNRNALKNAHAVLRTVDTEQEDSPSLHFLWGRLIWQLLQNKGQLLNQTKILKYSVDDARRHWEKSVELDSNSVLYATVLGFAYYAEGDLNRANDAWFKVLNSISKSSNTKIPKTVMLKDEMILNPLTAYAGLSLGLYKYSYKHKQSTGQQKQYFNEAVKLQQMVLKRDPTNFQLNELAKNWLWSEDTMKDWEYLLKQASSQG